MKDDALDNVDAPANQPEVVSPAPIVTAPIVTAPIVTAPAIQTGADNEQDGQIDIFQPGAISDSDVSPDADPTY